MQINQAFLDSPLHQFETCRISHGFLEMNLSNYRNNTIPQESSCNLNWSIPKKSKTDVEKGDKRISVSKYGIILIPTLYPDCIKKVVLPSILYKCELWCDLRQRDLQALSTLQHFICKNAMGLPKTTRSDICESLFGLLPISSEIDERKLLFLVDYVIQTLKPLPNRYFYIDCFPTYNPPNANNLALFTTSLLSCLSTISFNTSQFIFKLAILPRNFYGKNP